ncbi:MAG: YlxR family protein [Thermoleophilia bacterium]|nr:YlxR family protein [Thermoleophilia bacterium]
MKTPDSSSANDLRRVPVRTCIGCRNRATQDELVRVAAATDPETGSAMLVIDHGTHRSPGRGAWLHSDQSCITRAVERRAFSRALRIKIEVPAELQFSTIGDNQVSETSIHNEHGGFGHVTARSRQMKVGTTE